MVWQIAAWFFESDSEHKAIITWLLQQSTNRRLRFLCVCLVRLNDPGDIVFFLLTKNEKWWMDAQVQEKNKIKTNS